MRPPSQTFLVGYALVLFGCSLALCGCAEREYVGDGAFNTFALSESTPPIVETDEAALYLVEHRVEIPLREPTASEMGELSRGAAGLALPFARLPWVKRGDYRIEVDWVLYNLDDRRVDLALILNGFNEFDEYNPGYILDDDDIIPEFSQWERFVELEPFESISGTVREEQLEEVAVDLATVVNSAAVIDPSLYPNTPPLNPNQVVYFENHSSTDPRSIPYIPAVIPALTGVRMGIRSLAPANLVLEYTVRVTDEEKMLEDKASDVWLLPAPALFAPSSVFSFVP